LTILEVYTLVHAVYGYGVWFYKPLNIRDSTLINVSELLDELAPEFTRSKVSGKPPFTKAGLRGYYPPIFLPHTKKSEASVLLFDNNKSDAALGVPHTSLPTVEDILDPEPLYARPEGLPSRDNSTPSEHAVCKITDNNKSTVREVPVLHCPSAPGVDLKLTIATGQTLAMEIGPGFYATGDRKGKKLPSFIPAKFGLEHAAAEYVEVDHRLLTMVDLPHLYLDYGGSLSHQIRFSLSKKDVQRWQHAASAFARELATKTLSDDETPERTETKIEYPAADSRNALGSRPRLQDNNEVEAGYSPRKDKIDRQAPWSVQTPRIQPQCL
jgi:hypothetical protein